MRVLVIDDEPAFLLGLKKILQSPEMTVDTVETFEDAMDLLGSRKYEVVITDMRLTGVLREEGLDVIRYVKEHNPGTKVIIITGYGNQEIMEKARSLGADYYYEKPVPLEELKNALGGCISGTTCFRY